MIPLVGEVKELAYVKKIVGLQNGVIHAESEYGHGTKFIITLPTIKK